LWENGEFSTPSARVVIIAPPEGSCSARRGVVRQVYKVINEAGRRKKIFMDDEIT
jgi:hypothetical protein